MTILPMGSGGKRLVVCVCRACVRGGCGCFGGGGVELFWDCL